MNLKKILATALAAVAALSAWADQPFRDHRYDSFKATPTKPGQIVFVGNSITNMHSWFEAFGSHQEVVGRGNSGGFTTEVLANLESYIDSKPSKLFLMIGTNDISSGTSAEVNADRVKTIVKRIRIESPNTEIYLQTILPRSSNPKPAYEQNNTYLKEWVAAINDPKIHIINLSETCAGINGNGTWSHDGLHPRPIGYAAWCHEIADEVGYPTVYPQTIPSQESCGLGGSDAARAEQFPYFPVSEGDVLFFGDEQVHGAEWHELLNSNKIKDRGLKWGWGGIPLTNAKNVVTSALKDQSVKPAKIFLFYGIGGQDAANYRALVDETKAQAPNAKIYLVSLSPSADANTNNVRTNFNAVMQTVASEKGCTYVDVYTPLNENISQNIMNTNYISGRGYIVMANELAKYLQEENVTPVSLAEYEKVYAKRTARTIIGNALNNALGLEFGEKPGQIKESYKAQYDAAIAKAVAALDSDALTEATANAIAEELTPVIDAMRNDVNMPVSDKFYSLISSRGNYTVSVTDGVVAGAIAPSIISDGSDVWKFELRDDNTFNIVNAKGEYLNSTATYNTAVSVTDQVPARGFELSYSNAATGAYVIYSGTDFQLNQTQAAQNYKVYNWYNNGGGKTAPDRADAGCAYFLTEYEGTIVNPGNVVNKSGWYKINLSTDNAQVLNLETPAYFANNQQSYAMQYSADPVNTPNGWIYIVYNSQNGTSQIQGLNGYYIGDNVYMSRTGAGISMMPNADGTYNVATWDETTVGGVPRTLCRSANQNKAHKFTKISDTDLALYDIWTVSITGPVADKPVGDAKVSFNSAANKGLTSVYNGGYFFVTPGTEISVNDLTVTPPVGVEAETPVVSVNADTKQINVVITLEPLTPVLTVLNKEIGSVPYRVPDELAAPVLTSTSGASTAVFHVTISSRPSVFSVFSAAVDTTATSAFFCDGMINNGRVGVRYIGNQGTEGWYTKDHGKGQAAEADIKFVLVHDSQVGYTYYVNGESLGTAAAVSALGDYGFKHFANVANVNALYIGGMKTSDNEAKYMLSGTVKSARFYDKALSADDVAALQWDNLVADEVTANPGGGEIVAPSAITLSATTKELTIGETATLVATVEPDGVIDEVVWNSSNEAVATVANGVVTAVSVGSATITATCGDVTATCAVTVTDSGVQNGITNVEMDSDSSVIYDLQGRRVKSPVRGFYIVNGRKVIR